MVAFTPSTPFLLAWAAFLLLVAVIVVPIVLVLLFRLILACSRLNRHAAVADTAARAVQRNTAPVPQLAESLGLIREVLGAARTVETHTSELERVLSRGLRR